MVYVFWGDDIARAKQEVKNRTKEDVVLFGEGGDGFEKIPSYINSLGLFSKKLTFLLDRPTETEEGRGVLEKYMAELNETQHSVFVIETKLDAKTKKIFPSQTVFEEFSFSEKKEAIRPNVFTFTDTVLRRDKKNTWLGYQKLLRAGISAEEIHGALSWVVRAVLLSVKTKTAEESGLKPFVYKKSKQAGEVFGEEYFESFSRSLVSVYHQARAGKGDLELGLEKILLEKI